MWHSHTRRPLKDRQQHLASGRETLARHEGGKKKKPKATEEMEQRAAHYRSERVLQTSCQYTFGSLAGSEGVRRKVVAGNSKVFS